MTDQTQEPPFYLVWGDGTFPPKFRHESPEAASIEAQRLALENPGNAYFVLTPTTKIEVRAPLQIQHFDPNLYYIPF